MNINVKTDTSLSDIIRFLVSSWQFVLWLVLLIYAPFIANGQRNVSFKHLSIEQGLSQSTVLCMTSDKDGFMWFGTLDGLNKYDGYNMTVFRNNPNDKSSIADNAINCLYTDRNANLWIGIRKKGFARYNKVKGIFENYTIPADSLNKFVANNITSICDLPNQKLLLGSSTGLFVFNIKSNTFETLKNENESEFIGEITKVLNYRDRFVLIGTKSGLYSFNLANNQIQRRSICSKIDLEINNLFIDSKDSVWIATNNGLYSFHAQNLHEEDCERISSTHISSKKNGLFSDNISSIAEDNDGYFWIGTEESGIIKFCPQSKSSINYSHQTNVTGSLSVDEILSIYSDNAGIIWIGTSLGGINMFHKAIRKFETYTNNPYDDKSLSAKQVRCFYQDSENKIWIGTETGGLNLWDRKNEVFVHYKHKHDEPNSLSSNHIRSIVEENNQLLWIGTDGSGLELLNKKTKKVLKKYKANPKNEKALSNNRIWKLHKDGEGNIWIATFGGGLCRFNPKTENFKTYKNEEGVENSITDNKITTVFQDHEKRIWVGTYNGGLLLYDKANDGFIRIRDKKAPNRIDRIYSIIQDNNNFLWVGTRGILQKIHPKSFEVTNYEFDKYGFPNQVMMGLAEDSSGNIWVTTNHGISCFDTRSLTTKNYDSSDGLQSNEFMIGAYYTTKNGDILFGGVNGFNRFTPNDIVNNTHVPEIVITHLQILNKEALLDTAISEKRSLKLPYNKNALSFEFVVLDFVNPTKNLAKCIMKNFDSNFIDLGKRKYASYTLPPGKYEFKIIGSNNDKVWNEKGKCIHIEITPPFWKEYWFIGLMILIFSSLVYSVIHYRDLQRDRTKLERIVQQRTAKIMQQKEEITAQRDEIEKQRDLAEFQKQEITDSISYAKRIQNAILPPEDYIKRTIPENFIFFKPRDIVSGDFFWMKNIKTIHEGIEDELAIVAAADCTGHGVPGAFMSMLGVSFLNEIVNKDQLTKANEILDALREKIIESLHQTGRVDEPMDGMDIALMIIHKKTNKLQFAGAYNPLFLIRKHKNKGNPPKYELQQIKADRMPIGVHPKLRPFTNHIVEIEQNDLLYTFSDGYVDQFGEKDDKKFLTKRFKELLLNICHKPMAEQKMELENALKKWQGSHPQVDDILVMGVKV